MDAKQIKELMEKLHIFHSVYELQPIEMHAEKSHHQLLLIDDFATELEAEMFILEHRGSYHSLTIIKRYE